jgi:SAM-dependent methyltransferase
MAHDTSDQLSTGDAWGHALLDYLESRPVEQPELEIDDGTVVPAMDPEWFFRDHDDWEPKEQELIDLIRAGPVLDLGAGAGRAALHLQAKGLDVTAVESSPNAAEVCRRRGVADVRVQDLNDPPSDRRWRTVLLLCGNLGLGGSWAGNRRLLRRLAECCEQGALLIADSVNYEGRAEIGLRIRYRGLVTPWWRQRNVAAHEIRDLVKETGWAIERHVEADNGADHYLALRLRSPDP